MLRMVRGRLPNHPAWPLIKPYLEMQQPNRTRTRFEIDRTKIPIEKQLALLAIEMKCVVCDKTMHPVKKREGWRTFYVHVTCDATVNKGCSRSRPARLEIDAIIEALKSR